MSKKEEAERLEIQLQIQESLERQTKNLSSWRDAQKDLVKNARLLKSLAADIEALEESKFGKTKKQKQAIDEQIASLKKQQAQLISINKELSNTKNLLKAAGNSAIQAFKGLLPSLSEVIQKALELDDITRKTAANLGMSGNAFHSMKMATEEARQSAIRWNQPLDYAVHSIKSYNEETGRLVQLTTDQYDKIAQVSLQTGMAAEEVSTMAGQMEAFGMGATQGVQMIADIQAMSEQMGVNAGKVIKKFQQNLGLLNKMNFRGGMKAMAKMAAFSEKFKISMESIAGVSEKVFRPEGAVEAAAQLQMMGGSLAQLGDPFKLMYQARNAPEELMKSITKAASASATFNKETGEFQMSAHELDRMREAASALGMDYSELVQTAKQASKMQYMEKFLPQGMDKKDKDMILGMAQMTKDGPKVSFFDGGKQVFKKLDALTAADRKLITKQAADDKERAAQAKSVAGQWQSIQNGLLLIGVELLQPLINELAGDGALSGVLEGVKDGIIWVAKGIRSFFSEGGWEKIKQKFIEYKDEIILGIKIGIATGVAIFIGSWIVSQVAAGAAFGKGFRMTSGIGTSGATDAASKLVKDGKDNIPSPAKGKPGGPLMSLAKGLAKMGNPKVLFGALNLIPTAIGMVAMVPAIPTLLLFGTVKMGALYRNLSALGRGLTMMGNPQAALGAGVLVLAAVGFTAMTAGVIGLTAIALGGVAAGAGLTALATGLVSLGNPGTAAFAAIGVAILLGVGVAMMAMGAAIYFVASGIALIIDSFTNLFSVVSFENVGAMMLLGPALMLASLGIISLAGSLVIMGVALANPFGLLGLMGLAAAAYSLSDAMKGVDGNGITKAVDSINSVNTENIEALKSLSIWLGMMGNNIKIEFGEIKVDGEIDLMGGSGSKVSSDLLKNTEFTNELKRIIAEHTHFDKKGGN